MGNEGDTMKIISLLILLLVGLNTNASHSKIDSSAIVVGQRNFTFVDSKRNRSLATYVWYPADSGKVSQIGHSGPFLPVKAALNANLSNRKEVYPVVLISHGAGGKAEKLFWLTSSLVNSGMIVVGVDHPGNMTGDNSANGILRPWLRAQDLTFVLNEILKNETLGNQMDQKSITAIGHSAGGTTVLLLAGAKFKASKFESPIPNCGTSKDPYVVKFCKEIASIDVHSFSMAEVEGDYSDSRVKGVVALDPGFARSFDSATLTKSKEKILVIGADKQPAPEDEIYSKEFKSLLPSSYEILPGSIHLTFLQPCKKGMESEDEEIKVLCTENSKKIEMQKKAATRTIKFLNNVGVL